MDSIKVVERIGIYMLDSFFDLIVFILLFFVKEGVF